MSAAMALVAVLLVTGLLWALPDSAAPRPGTLVVEVVGFRNHRGKALVGVFTGPDGFPDGRRAARRVELAIKGGSARAELALPPGEYAVSVLHDENGNYRLDTGLFGRPKEGYGASNNARNRFGPPDYEDARFRIEPGGRVIQRIRLIY